MQWLSHRDPYIHLYLVSLRFPESRSRPCGPCESDLVKERWTAGGQKGGSLITFFLSIRHLPLTSASHPFDPCLSNPPSILSSFRRTVGDVKI